MFFKTIDFSRYSSIKIGQPTEVLMIEKEDILPSDRYLIGGANNVLVSPAPPPLMMLSKDFAYMKQTEDGMLEIGAAMPTGRIVSYARKHDLSGFEFCAKLPGTLGGMLAMNAGVKTYEIFNILQSVEIDRNWIPKENIPYGYRYARLNGTATAARFPAKAGFNRELLDTLLAMRNNQPHHPSAGSAFKNPPDDYAGRLIEAAGLKGLKKGAMQWSNLHANFLINLGGGSYEDARYLIDLAKEKVFETFGITLQEEIKIL
ncbi:UDP-N-acetylmuramate dehydrogenase [Sulfurovum sp.]|uniref:UDP-N-acetylmuramate dehydrogenase n=1 Tax=Sulfurovum sp. TaxID=1969726 RepID=UPI0025D88357|nr:UDP-N-acetylmuramate dehydrogenase [Sulfurovum sp.]